MNNNGSLISNGFWSLTTQIVRVGSLAAIMIALSRHFGPQRFGTLAVGLAFVRIFAVLATFGLDKIVVRHLVDHRERFSAIVRESFRLKLAIAMLSYVAMIAVILAIGDGDRLLLYIGMFGGAPSSLLQSIIKLSEETAMTWNIKSLRIGLAAIALANLLAACGTIAPNESNALPNGVLEQPYSN